MRRVLRHTMTWTGCTTHSGMRVGLWQVTWTGTTTGMELGRMSTHPSMGAAGCATMATESWPGVYRRCVHVTAGAVESGWGIGGAGRDLRDGLVTATGDTVQRRWAAIGKGRVLIHQNTGESIYLLNTCMYT